MAEARRILAGGIAVLLATAVYTQAQVPGGPAGSNAEASRPPDRAMQAQAHYELGVMYHERVFESLDQAITEYEKAIKVKPDYAEAHYNLGLSYHTKAKLGTDDQGLYRKALAEYKQYIKYSPQGEWADKAKQNIKAVEARLRK